MKTIHARFSSGLLHGVRLGAIAVGRGAEDVGAQVVAGDRAVRGLLNCHTSFRWHFYVAARPLNDGLRRDRGQIQLGYRRQPQHFNSSVNRFHEPYLTTG